MRCRGPWSRPRAAAHGAVDQEFVDNDYCVWALNLDWAQTFTPAAPSLAAVDFFYSVDTAGEVEVSIRQGGPDGAVLASTVVAASTGGLGTPAHVELLAPVAVTPGSTYAIRLHQLSGRTQVCQSFSDGYAGGTGFQCNPACTARPVDLSFRTYAPPPPPPPSRYRDAVLASGPALYWRLGEAGAPTAADESGNGHHGTYAPGWQYGLPGAPAGDPDTAGGQPAGTRAGVTGPPSAPNPADNFTVAMWLRDQGTTNALGYLRKGGSGGTPGWRLHYNDRALWFSVATSAGNRVCRMAPMPTDGAWHHLAAVVRVDTISTFVDGVQTNTCNYLRGRGLASAAPLELLGLPNTAAHADEVTVWTRPLSAGEIAALHTAGR